VLLVSEDPVAELTHEAVVASTPHLDERAREGIWQRYLGQTTWRDLCRHLAVDCEQLPRTIAEV
jgi:hypothetical protein